MKRRGAALWLVLFAVYAGTIGMRAFDGSQYAGDEPHYLLTAKSIVDDGNVDLTDEYRERSYRAFYPLALEPHGLLTRGRLNEPHGIGFPLLIAPAYAIGGTKGVELLLAAIAAPGSRYIGPSHGRAASSPKHPYASRRLGRSAARTASSAAPHSAAAAASSGYTAVE